MRITALTLTALAVGCASQDEAVHATRPTPPAELVRQQQRQLDGEALQAVGLDAHEQRLQADFVAAVAAGRRRHAHADQFTLWEPERAAIDDAWTALADHYRARLVADLRHDRLQAFHARAQALLPFARRALLEAQLDALAQGRGELTAAFDTLHDALASDRRGYVDADGRLRVEDIGLPAVFTRDAYALIHSERFERVAAGLGQAVFRIDRAGRPVVDHALTVELLHQRGRLLARLDGAAQLR